MNFQKLSNSELEQILQETPVDIIRRQSAREELERRKKAPPWTRAEKWTAAAVIVAVVGITISTDFRRLISLGSSPPAPNMQTSSIASGPAQQSQTGSATNDATPAGVWTESSSSVPKFYEFLPGGRLKVRYSLSRPSTISDDETWYRVQDTIVVVDEGPFPSRAEGKLNGDSIQGSFKYRDSSGVTKWRLDRITVPEIPKATKTAAKQGRSELDGRWVDPEKVTTTGKPIIYEFLPNTRLRLRYGDGSPFIVANGSWYRTGGSVRIVFSYKEQNTTEILEGTIKDGAIEGTILTFSNGASVGNKQPWKLQRMAD